MSTSRGIWRNPSPWSDLDRTAAPRPETNRWPGRIAASVATALVGLGSLGWLGACERPVESPATHSDRVVPPATPVDELIAAAPESLDFPPALLDAAFDAAPADPIAESAGSALAVQPSESGNEAAGGAAPAGLLSRVVLIGASLTQGFGASIPVADPENPDAPPNFVPVALGDALVASMRDEFRPAVAQGDLFFFMRPDRSGERLAAMALARDPSLLVALDFLFWFGYGQLAPGETRAARLERGFALLSPLESPIVVADFPDLREAVGRMISPAQMPSDDELRTLNRMLREWADARGNVAILPLAAMLETLRNGSAVTVAGATWQGDAVVGLLQEDRMHATPAGMLVVVRQLVEEIVSLEPTVGAVSALLLEPTEALRRLEEIARSRVKAPPRGG